MVLALRGVVCLCMVRLGMVVYRPRCLDVANASASARICSGAESWRRRGGVVIVEAQCRKAAVGAGATRVGGGESGIQRGNLFPYLTVLPLLPSR